MGGAFFDIFSKIIFRIKLKFVGNVPCERVKKAVQWVALMWMSILSDFFSVWVLIC